MAIFCGFGLRVLAISLSSLERGLNVLNVIGFKRPWANPSGSGLYGLALVAYDLEGARLLGLRPALRLVIGVSTMAVLRAVGESGW